MFTIVTVIRQRSIRIAAALGLTAAVLVLGVVAGLGRQASVQAGGGGFDWYVSPSGSNTDCRSWSTACHTIAQAVISATSGDRIHVAAGFYNEHLTLNKSLAITGTHPDRGLVTTINGSAQGAVITVNSNYTVSVSGATIKNAQSAAYGGGLANHGTLRLNDVVLTGITAAEYGGGLYNDGRATLDDVTISANTVMTDGGGIYNNVGGVVTLTNVVVNNNQVSGGPGGGIFNFGTVILSDVVISGNVASGSGGGLLTQGSASLNRVTLDGNVSSAQSGGGIANDGDLTLTDVTLKGNTAPSGGGIWNWTNGEAHLTNVTLYSNTAATDRGGGLWNQNGVAYLVNVTLSGNVAQIEGGGIHNQFGTLDVTNATIAYNKVVTSTATRAGGIANTPGGIANVENSIIAFNNNRNCSGTISSYYGRNLDSSADNTCQVADDVVGFDPLLGPLQNNGGATLTHALGRESWAIDNGENNVCPSTDQRGWHRPIDGDGNGYGIATCDIGAFEVTIPVYLPAVLRDSS